MDRRTAYCGITTVCIARLIKSANNYCIIIIIVTYLPKVDGNNEQHRNAKKTIGPNSEATLELL